MGCRRHSNGSVENDGCGEHVFAEMVGKKLLITKPQCNKLADAVSGAGKLTMIFGVCDEPEYLVVVHVPDSYCTAIPRVIARIPDAAGLVDYFLGRGDKVAESLLVETAKVDVGIRLETAKRAAALLK